MNELERLLSPFFREKMPPLSDEVRSGAVKYLPWAMIVLGAVGLAGLVSVLGMFNFASLITRGTVGWLAIHTFSVFDLLMMYVVAPLLQVANIVAGYWMLKRQLRGWRLALLTLVLGFFSTVIHFSLVGLLINFFFVYLLFQIRDQYSDQ